MTIKKDCFESLPSLVPTNFFDDSPRFDRSGTRIFLSDQHLYTRRETWFWRITSPLLAWRWARLHLSGRYPRDILTLPDPTIVIPTGKTLFQQGLYVAPPPDAAALNSKILENYYGQPDDEEEWKHLRHLSRVQRLELIDRRPKFDRFGRRILLAYQRGRTTWESILEIATAPIFIWGALWEVKRWVQMGSEHNWDMAAFRDPTVIIPTGRRYFPKEELLDHNPCPLD